MRQLQYLQTHTHSHKQTMRACVYVFLIFSFSARRRYSFHLSLHAAPRYTASLRGNANVARLKLCSNNFNCQPEHLKHIENANLQPHLQPHTHIHIVTHAHSHTHTLTVRHVHWSFKQALRILDFYCLSFILVCRALPLAAHLSLSLSTTPPLSFPI